jgi:ABC-type xylose transport system permease subunit
MSGVEILNQTIVYEQTTSFIPVIICGSVGIIVGFLIGYFEAYEFVDGFLGAFAGIFIGVLIGLILSVGTTKTTDKIDYIKYQVTISDEVNFNEFCDKYEILKQEGKIYTVKEVEK